MRILDVSDGYTSATAPTITGSAARSFEDYANDAAYEAANGSPSGGEVYHNTTDNVIKIYLNGSWREMAVFE